MDLNKIFLVGRLTRDPESKMLPSGTAVANFGLATNRYFTDKSGEKQQEVEFHNISTFGRIAESASQYLKKGGLVLIEGRIKTRSWDDKEGNKRYTTEIIAERLQFGPRSEGPIQPKQAATTTSPTTQKEVKEEDIPVIEQDKEEINIKDIPF